jgi:hypothetical protein
MERRMPLARYFLIVGGLLLALLIIADACMTTLPVVERADSNRVAIRIRSEMKLPERVVLDTTLPTLVAPQTASTDTSDPAAAATDVPATAREAFAQLQSSNQVRVTEPKKQALKQRRQRTVARRYVGPPTRMVARQPQFGWFGTWFW